MFGHAFRVATVNIVAIIVADDSISSATSVSN
jgi:hypothetical protein